MDTTPSDREFETPNANVNEHQPLTAQEMLQVITPDDSVIAVVRFTSKGSAVHKFFDAGQRVEATAWTANHQDTSNTFFAMSGFKPLADHVKGKGKGPGWRLGLNVLHTLTLWVDVDGKDFNKDDVDAGKALAHAALLEFLKASGMPMPTIIANSGGGWHVYWVMDQALDHAAWQPLADALKALCKQHGFKIDAGCTSDRARVLRLAGSLNHKFDPPRQVTAWRTGEVVPVATMRKLLHGKGGKAWTQTRTKANGNGADIPGMTDELRAAMDAEGDDNAALAGEGVDRGPARMAGILEGCAVMQDALDTGGENAPQPLWKDILGVAAFAGDGREYIHKLSEGHSDYTEQETEKKFQERLDYAGSGGGPPRCETIAGNWDEKRQGVPCPCSTCEYFDRIGSPVTLGRGSGAEAAQGGGPDGSTGEAQVGQGAGSDPREDKEFRTDYDRGDIPSTVEAAIAYLSQHFFVLGASGNALIGRFVHNPALNHVVLQTSRPQDFKLLTNKKVVASSDDKKKLIRAGEAWLGSNHRPQFSATGLHITSPVPKGTLNLWRGWGVDPAPGDWSLMEKHIRLVICGGVERDWRWLTAWLADAVQNPEHKKGTSVVLRGAQGAGKGVFATEFGKLWGSHWLHIIQRDHLVGRFNDHLEGKVFLFADEALFAGDKKVAGALKGLITEKTIPMEAKYRGLVTIPNLLHIMMATNADWAVPAELDDRRFFLPTVDPGAKNHRGFFTALIDQMNNGGREAWLHYLLNLDLPAYLKEHEINLRKPPVTAGLLDQKGRSGPAHERWWRSVLAAGVLNDWKGIHTNKDTRRWDKEWPEAILTVRLYELYQEFCKSQHERHPLAANEFGEWLRNTVNLRQTRPRADLPLHEDKQSYGGGYTLVRGPARRRAYKLPWLKDARREFEARMGGKMVWTEGDPEGDNDGE